MEEIFFIVQNGTVEDINGILKSLYPRIPKALKSRFQNMHLIVRDYMNTFNSNSMMSKTTTL